MKRGDMELFNPFHIAVVFETTIFQLILVAILLIVDSGTNQNTNRELVKVAVAAIKKGRDIEDSANIPPKAGPKMTPEDRAAPSCPILFVLSAFSVKSAIYALAAGTVAEENTPCMNLERNSIHKELAVPKKMKLTVIPMSPVIIMGFLPNLSDSLPQKGEKRS